VPAPLFFDLPLRGPEDFPESPLKKAIAVPSDGTTQVEEDQ